MKTGNIQTATAHPPRFQCFSEFLNSMKQHPLATAIHATDAPHMTYGDIVGQIGQIIFFLNAHGLGRNDRIGVIMPEGPEMALVFLGTVACATFVPLVGNLSGKEYEFLISNIGIKALIIHPGTETSAVSVAGQFKIPVIEVTRKKASEALLDLSWKAGPTASASSIGTAGPEDVAMVLNTSGTTSSPKFVPLTHFNIFSSAYYIAKALRLRESDRSLHMMRMIHIAGLISSIISPMTVGGSIVCAPSFSAESFFDWLEEFRPTWYTAVSPMHQAIVEKADKLSFQVKNTSLRFIRSVSNPISDPLVERLEHLFRVPVIQAYGLTEALSISCTPLDPYIRKPGSVGVVFCPEVAIINDEGSPLGVGETGEIAVRGPHVLKAYENNPEANQKAFVRGWFRTGDMGHMYEDGYLYITGRLKDIINRGGQKVSPQEVEATLLTHPAVRDGCIFSVPHNRLGEAVAGVAVLKCIGAASEREIRQYIADKMDDYKVPQQIAFVDVIPKNDMGKVQRAAVCERFAHLFKPAYVTPATEMEVMIAGMWSDLLGITPVGRLDNFFALGGDSLMATRLVSKIKSNLEIELPLVTIFQHTTVQALAEVVSRSFFSALGDDVLVDLITEIESLTDEEAMISLKGNGGPIQIVNEPQVNIERCAGHLKEKQSRRDKIE